MAFDFGNIGDFISKISGNGKSFLQENNIDIKDILSDQFLSEHSKFDSYDKMKNDSQLDLEDLDRNQDDDLDRFAKEETNFNSWQDLLIEGAKRYFNNR